MEIFENLKKYVETRKNTIARVGIQLHRKNYTIYVEEVEIAVINQLMYCPCTVQCRYVHHFNNE